MPKKFISGFPIDANVKLNIFLQPNQTVNFSEFHIYCLIPQYNLFEFFKLNSDRQKWYFGMAKGLP